MRETVSFQSEGERIEAHWYTPDTVDGPWAIVVMAGGWCYVKELAQPVFAQAFTEFGLAALVFDYRTMGGSSGSPRQHIDPWAQIEDYRNAVSYLEQRPDVDQARIGAWGISYSGGHVLILGAIDERIRCVSSVVPVIDGWQNLRLAHGTVGFRRLQKRLLEARKERFETDAHAYLPHATAHPERDVVTWPFPASGPMFERLKRNEAPAYENRATTLSTELLLAYSVFPYLGRLLGTPTQLIVAERDDHTHWDLAAEAFRQVDATEKEFSVIPRSTHHTLYEDKDHQSVAARRAASWMAEHLIAR